MKTSIDAIAAYITSVRMLDLYISILYGHKSSTKTQNEIDTSIELHACSLLVDLGQSQGHCQIKP